MTPLRQRMLQDMQIRNLSPGTQKEYGAPLYASQRTLVNRQISLGAKKWPTQ